jgi:hypothetical protein
MMNIKVFNNTSLLAEMEHPLEALGFISETRDMLHKISQDYTWTHIICNNRIRITDTPQAQVITFEAAE